MQFEKLFTIISTLKPSAPEDQETLEILNQLVLIKSDFINYAETIWNKKRRTVSIQVSIGSRVGEKSIIWYTSVKGKNFFIEFTGETVIHSIFNCLVASLDPRFNSQYEQTEDGLRIREIREELGYSQKEFAQILRDDTNLEISQSYLCEIEKGKYVCGHILPVIEEYYQKYQKEMENGTKKLDVLERKRRGRKKSISKYRNRKTSD